jgi:hypothetical protein
MTTWRYSLFWAATVQERETSATGRTREGLSGRKEMKRSMSSGGIWDAGDISKDVHKTVYLPRYINIIPLSESAL